MSNHVTKLKNSRKRKRKQHKEVDEGFENGSDDEFPDQVSVSDDESRTVTGGQFGFVYYNLSWILYD